MNIMPGKDKQFERKTVAEALAGGRILMLDGATGTMLQKLGLGESDFRSGVLTGCAKELKGDNECLNLTRPDIVRSLHTAYIAAGADIIETNTFGANRIAQEEYGCAAFAYDMAFNGARLAREAADESMQGGCGRQIFVRRADTRTHRGRRRPSAARNVLRRAQRQGRPVRPRAAS